MTCLLHARGLMELTLGAPTQSRRKLRASPAATLPQPGCTLAVHGAHEQRGEALQAARLARLVTVELTQRYRKFVRAVVAARAPGARRSRAKKSSRTPVMSPSRSRGRQAVPVLDNDHGGWDVVAGAWWLGRGPKGGPTCRGGHFMPDQGVSACSYHPF